MPLCFYGPQFRAGAFEAPVESVDVAPTLARAMGVAAPSSATGPGAGRSLRDLEDPMSAAHLSPTNLCGIALRNPVLAASGTFGYGLEFEKLVDLDALGGLVVKGLSREPIEGNPPPRLYETEAGMINSIGLQNIGVRAFVSEKLPALARLSTAVFANVFGYQPDDYVEVVRVLEDHAGPGRATS